jgi:hypothetical protein
MQLQHLRTELNSQIQILFFGDFVPIHLQGRFIGIMTSCSVKKKWSKKDTMIQVIQRKIGSKNKQNEILSLPHSLAHRDDTSKSSKTGTKTPGFLGIIKVISRSNYDLYTMQIDR